MGILALATAGGILSALMVGEPPQAPDFADAEAWAVLPDQRDVASSRPATGRRIVIATRSRARESIPPRADLRGLPICRVPHQTGCIAAWNAVG